jgi:hypothetical protein
VVEPPVNGYKYEKEDRVFTRAVTTLEGGPPRADRGRTRTPRHARHPSTDRRGPAATVKLTRYRNAHDLQPGDASRGRSFKDVSSPAERRSGQHDVPPTNWWESLTACALEGWYRYGESNPGPVAENHVS